MMQFNVSSSERDYETDYDVVIIGAGAAGYSAGVYIKRSGMSVAILERESVLSMAWVLTRNVSNTPAFSMSLILLASMILRVDDVIASKKSSAPQGGAGGMGGMPGGMGGY